MNHKARRVTEPGRDVPVLDEVDVLVAGGGVSGCAAALAAARVGAKTVLLERNGCLGGVVTAAMMASIGNFAILSSGEQVVHGIAGELIDRMVDAGAASPRWCECKAVAIDCERFKVLLIDLLAEAGVTTLTHAVAARPIMAGKRVAGCFVESKSGRRAILAKNTVDATGELDLAAQTPAAVETHRGNGSLLFKMTSCDLDRFVDFLGEDVEGYPADCDRIRDYAHLVRMWREAGAFFFPHYGGKRWRFLQEKVARGEFRPDIAPAFNLDVMGMYGLRATGHVVINSTYYIFEHFDVRELSRYELHAQKMCYYVGDFLRRSVPGFEKARVEQVGVDLGVRGARYLRGRATLGPETVKGEGGPQRFDDVIGTWPVRRPSPTDYCFADETFDIPVGILVPRGATHLLSGSGKSASTDGGHTRLVRGMTGCMIIGQAGGVAAAIGAAKNVSAGNAPIRDVQRELLRQNVRLGDAGRLRQLNLA